METATENEAQKELTSKDVAILVSGLSKRYLIGGEKKGTLTETLAGMIGAKNNRKEEFWALQDINFEVKKGEVIGIIGKNGAGKSTLLKILSRITQPTTGKIEINGRVASLLEVGTGFHPELTGRENIYLNGTILGMSRQEVKAKFEEIVEFSGVRKFIDTPVKHYSSGMYVRLAFAVAAHLEPEILIIDEVLAVGDAEFQKKCLGKMKEVAGEGRTVLFVSHNMSAVKSLCERGIHLKAGQIVSTGAIEKVVGHYLSGGQKAVSSNKKQLNISSEGLTLNEIIISSDTNDENNTFPRENKLNLSIDYTNSVEEPVTFTFKFKGEDGNTFLTTNTGWTGGFIKTGKGIITLHIPSFFFNEGLFSIDLLAVKSKKKAIISQQDILQFSILPENKPLGSWMGKDPAYIKPHFSVSHK